ncbi:helix-turn-helix domain-containing protein [Jeotgalibaca sp. MA1X17-3]|uniref:helix-turn-helix domain-containing protein n=1 Tax=Jeotgalibaca sp. MA1X17-3 TaxID=2908211 RepID=UPI001F463B6C|nr:helix-turn-helix domain-containing protein [Jeotgalibaca sp. MA1X17-3]UJF16294.1 helix-turn-helix domain-containing protein [Jeotgalibaca sp. MA1X17-3]
MWDLVPSNELRKYKILDAIYYSNDWMTISTLAKKTSSSERSIKYDLKELENYIEYLNGEVITSSKGIRLTLPPNIGIDYFQRNLYKNIPAFKLLEYIFFNKEISDHEAEELLFISSSSLKRLVVKVKDALAPYGLVLSTNPFQIHGDERLIRSFFSAYFNERYSLEEWSFPNIHLLLIDALNDYLHHYFKTSSDNVDYHFLKIQLAVNITRERQSFPTILPYSIIFEHRNLLYKETVSEITRMMQPFNLSLQESQAYLNQLMNWKFYFSTFFLDDPTPEYELTLEYKSMQTELKQIKKMIEKLSSIFSLPKADHIHLIYKLNNVITNYLLFPSTIIGNDYILFNPTDFFLNRKFKEEYPVFYSLVQQNILNICKKRGLSLKRGQLIELTYTLLSNWEHLIPNMYSIFDRLKILVFSHYHSIHAFNISTELSSELNDSITIEIYKESTLNQYSLKDYTFDILFSTRTLLFDIKQPVIYLKRVNGKLDIQHFNIIISETIKENKKPLKKRKKQLSIKSFL